MADDLACFHELLGSLESGLGGSRTMAQCNGHLEWPRCGVYFFLDLEEPCALGPGGIRVVRVGTHGLKVGAKSTLWGRLRTHKGTLAGGGNHRASVFRRHVGESLMVSNPGKYDVSTWNKTRPNSTKARDNEGYLEQAVSDYIGSLKLLWIAVPDAQGASSERAYLEKNAIALLSGSNTLPSDHWLGHSSPNPAIRMSGLWNVSQVHTECDQKFLYYFESHVEFTIGEIGT